MSSAKTLLSPPVSQSEVIQNEQTSLGETQQTTGYYWFLLYPDIGPAICPHHVNYSMPSGRFLKILYIAFLIICNKKLVLLLGSLLVEVDICPTLIH